MHKDKKRFKQEYELLFQFWINWKEDDKNNEGGYDELN